MVQYPRHSKAEKAKVVRMENNTCGQCGRPIRAVFGRCPGVHKRSEERRKAKGEPPPGVVVYRNGKRVTGKRAEWIKKPRRR